MLNIFWLCEYSSQNDFIGNLFQPCFFQARFRDPPNNNNKKKSRFCQQHFIITLFKLIKINPLYNAYKIIQI